MDFIFTSSEQNKIFFYVLFIKHWQQRYASGRLRHCGKSFDLFALILRFQSFEQRLENWSQSIYALLEEQLESSIPSDVNAYVAEILQEVMLLVRTFEFHANLVKPSLLPKLSSDAYMRTFAAACTICMSKKGFLRFISNLPLNLFLLT